MSISRFSSRDRTNEIEQKYLMKKYRTGIAGFAHIHSHLYSLSTVPNIELVAAVAQTEVEKKTFQAYGLSTFYQSYEEMLDSENLDIVEIDSDPGQRYKMTLAAAKRRIHGAGRKTDRRVSRIR